jgi:hypothetical protein
LLVSDAVEREVVGLLALPVDVGTAAAGVLQAVERPGIRRRHTSRVECRGREVAALDGELLDLLALELIAHHRVLRLQDGTGGDDLDALLDRAELQPEVDASGLRGLQLCLRLHALEALHVDADDVAADGDAGDDVVTRVVGDTGVGDVGRLVGGGDGKARDGPSGVVRDDPGDRR